MSEEFDYYYYYYYKNDLKIKTIKTGLSKYRPLYTIWPEIYTSECRKMQLRIFVKTKFSGGTCPRTPPPPSQTSLADL